jgi:hypothetical protein
VLTNSHSCKEGGEHSNNKQDAIDFYFDVKKQSIFEE